MAKAIAYLAARWESHPSLEQTARVAGLSPWPFQKAFRRWVGVSPKQFQGALSLDYARAHLAAGAPVLEAALATGLSGPSRLHDLAINFDAVTPGEIRTGGDGIILRTGTAATPFGRIFVAASERGITRLAFITKTERDKKAALRTEQTAWPHACFKDDDKIARDVARQLFAPKTKNGGGTPSTGAQGHKFSDQGMAGINGDLAGRRCQLSSYRQGHWQPAGSPRSRQRLRGQSHRRADPLPPGPA
jgi:AraC family transcriptional regulator of adaptative response/methylated-DNA-[protein]-cysteine methyltransferase